MSGVALLLACLSLKGIKLIRFVFIERDWNISTQEVHAVGSPRLLKARLEKIQESPLKSATRRKTGKVYRERGCSGR